MGSTKACTILAAVALLLAVLALLASWAAFNMAYGNLSESVDRQVQRALPENNDHNTATNTEQFRIAEPVAEIVTGQ